MRLIQNALIGILAGMFIEVQQANAFSAYKCTVKNSYELKRNGMVPHRLSKLHINREFVVDQATGRMQGDLSSASWIGKNEVLDIGSNEQSYKAIYISPPFVHVRLLQIKEYDRGPIKDFILTEDTEVLTGTCTHLN